MRVIAAILCFLSLSLVLPPMAQGAADSRNLVPKSNAAASRVALVIGNAKYALSPLKNPANDARDMARALRGLGFDVIEKTDVTQKEMLRAITQFGEKLAANSVALFFYAGHGMQVRGKNYLIPIDAQIASEASVRSEAVDVDALLDQLGNSALNVVILDACRNNPFERRFRSMGGGLAQMEAPKGTLIAYATSPGKTAADGEGRNGLYTQELLRLIQTPGLPVEAVFKRVRANVAKATRDDQIPWESSSLTGDFYFRTPAATAASTEAAPIAQENPLALELAFWDSIKDSRSKDEFDAYLDKFPQGQFRQLALARVKALESKPAADPQSAGKTARLYLLRESSLIGALGAPDLLLDGQPFGELANGTYLVMDVPAGKRVLSAVNSSYSFIRKTLDLSRGGVFYYRFSFDDYNNLISPMDEEDGKRTLAATSPGKMPEHQSASPAVASALPGKLIVYRESAFTGSAVTVSVSVDGMKRGTLSTGSYLTIDAPPGTRQAMAHVEVNRGSCSQTVNVESGRSHYFKVEVLWGSGCELIPVQEDGGQQEISRLERKN